MNKELNDIELVNASLNGDLEAFSTLVEKYRNYVYRFILKSGASLDIAEDLAQETFLRAYKGLGSFQGKSTFNTWLCGIARHITLNHFRKTMKTREHFISSDVLEKISSSSMDPGKEHIKRENIENMFKDLNALPVDLKEVLTLVFFEDFSYAETAEMLGIPEGTVKSKIYRARKMLKNMNFSRK